MRNPISRKRQGGSRISDQVGRSFHLLTVICRVVSLHYELKTVGGESGMKQVSNLSTKRAFAGSTYSRLVIAGLALVAALATSAQAQDDRMTPIVTPAQPNAVEIGTGPLPD